MPRTSLTNSRLTDIIFKLSLALLRNSHWRQ